MAQTRQIGDLQNVIPSTALAFGLPGDVAVRVDTDHPLPVSVYRAANTGSTPLGYAQLTDLSSPTNLNPPTGARYALIQCDAQNVRWRDDGTDPTATTGMRLSNMGELLYDSNLTWIRFVEEDAGAILNISYYGVGPNTDSAADDYGEDN